jgi:hypothetical protein
MNYEYCDAKLFLDAKLALKHALKSRTVNLKEKEFSEIPSRIVDELYGKEVIYKISSSVLISKKYLLRYILAKTKKSEEQSLNAFIDDIELSPLIGSEILESLPRACCWPSRTAICIFLI